VSELGIWGDFGMWCDFVRSVNLACG